MAIVNQVSDFFHFFRDYKKVYTCKNQYVFRFLPFHVIDKHNPLSRNRNFIVFSDRPRNMYIAMSKLIRQFNFKVFWCPGPESHGNVYSDTSWEASRTSKARSETD